MKLAKERKTLFFEILCCAHRGNFLVEDSTFAVLKNIRRYRNLRSRPKKSKKNSRKKSCDLYNPVSRYRVVPTTLKNFCRYDW